MSFNLISRFKGIAIEIFLRVCPVYTLSANYVFFFFHILMKNKIKNLDSTAGRIKKRHDKIIQARHVLYISEFIAL